MILGRVMIGRRMVTKILLGGILSVSRRPVLEVW